MNLSFLSIPLIELYEDLRDNVEYRETDDSGFVWGTVHLENAKKQRTKQKFAALLKELQGTELYKPIVPYFGNDKPTFGKVKI